MKIICPIAILVASLSFVSAYNDNIEQFEGGSSAAASHGKSIRGKQQQVKLAAASLMQNHNEQQQQSRGFDFVVAGFPQCGSNTLVKAFSTHDETDISIREQCSIVKSNVADRKVDAALNNALSTLDSHKKRSFKCPTTLYAHKAITRLEDHSPGTKLVIGMRHPVEMLQSLYNKRVAETKKRNPRENIPSLPDILLSGREWKDVSATATRLDLFLMQLGKAHLSAQDMKELARQHIDLTIRPNQLQVFLYTLDQLGDDDINRSKSFRTGLQNFLELEKPMEPLDDIDDDTIAQYPESINICDDSFDSIREHLVQQGSQAANWIREQLLRSSHVHVANKEHFLTSVESWSTDPCGKQLVM